MDNDDSVNDFYGLPNPNSPLDNSGLPEAIIGFNRIQASLPSVEAVLAHLMEEQESAQLEHQWTLQYYGERG